MQIANRQLYEKMSFEDYLKIPAFSYSRIANNGIPVKSTPKMRFGSLVDAYTFEPTTYAGEQYKLVRTIAKTVNNDLGGCIKTGKPQLVVTCDMIYEDMIMKFKGRIDLYCGQLVVDMKVSKLVLATAIEHFGYNHQLNGYALAVGARASVIYSIHPEKITVQKTIIGNSSIWWEKQVLRFGEPIKTTA